MNALRKISIALLCLFLYSGHSVNAMFQQQPTWAEDLEFEFLTSSILYSSLDRPKLKLRVTNVGDEAFKYMGFSFRPDNATQNFPGCATFPNGGFLNLSPGESTIVSTWSACYFGDGLPFEKGTSDHIAEFQFTQNNETFSHIEEFQIVNDEGRQSPSSADGNEFTISGRITIKGGYFPQVKLYVKTRNSLEMEIETEPSGEGELSFSFPAQQGFDWYLVTTAEMQDE